MKSKIIKYKIDNKEYSFVMNNKNVMKIDEKYGDYCSVVNGLVKNVSRVTNAIKIVSASCVEKDFKFDELVELLTPDQISNSVIDLALGLYLDYRGVEVKKEDDDKKVKKEKASQV